MIDIHGMDGVVGDSLSYAGLLLLVREQAGQIDALRRCVAHLERELSECRVELSQCRVELAAARKNSSNSSKPPSGDITRPPRRLKGRGKSKRKIGGQPNHPKHQRPPFPPDQVDEVHDHTLDHCPDCGGAQGQRTLSSLCGKDFHQELVAPAGDFALAFDAVFRGMALE